MKKLAIILGAGASHSLNVKAGALDNGGFRPPLTQDLFADSAAFAPILNKYKRAQVLSSMITRQLAGKSKTSSLEQILKSYDDRLKSGEDSHITRGFLEIPLYLNELLGEVSQHFTKKPDEYNILLQAALDSADEVLFLTLNYDALLEISLNGLFGLDFSDIRHYIGNQKWSLVKLHGSVNWYRQFKSFTIARQDNETYFSNLNAQTFPFSLGDDFMMKPIPGHQRKFHGSTPLYPAITVPVDRKYEFNCPDPMIQHAKAFLGDCENHLIIGSAGNDKDLLDLLKNNSKGGHTLFVGRSKENVSAASLKFLRGAPQLGRGFDQYSHPDGFAAFIRSDKFESYMAAIK